MAQTKERKKEYNKEYRLTHKKEKRAYSKQYYSTHKTGMTEEQRRNKREYDKQRYAANPECKKQYESEHRPETNERVRKRYAISPEIYKNKKLKYMYGITLSDYGDMYNQQDGKCAICGKYCGEINHKQNLPLSVDHDHITGEVRELLCINCNFVIGNAKESIEILSKSIKYLIKHKNDTI